VFSERVKFNPKYVQMLEEWIDKLDEELPPLRNFILPVSGDNIFNEVLK
jgi:cob(I)alamin adenosyltransferase